MSVESESERLFTGETGRIFIVLTLMAAVVKIGRYAIPPLLPAIIDDLGITSSTAGIALTLMIVVFSVSQFPSGRLSDELSRKTLLSVSVGCVLVGFAVLTSAVTYVTFLLGVVFVGLGDGFYSVPARSRLTELYERRRGQAFSVHMIALDIGGVAATGLAVAVLAVGIWRTAFVPLVVLLATGAVLYLRWDREAFVVERVSLEVGDTVRRLFAVPELRVLVLAYSLYMFALQGVLGFLPTFLHAEQGFSSAFASGLFALLFAVGLVARPVSGWISDRVSRPLVAACALFVALVGLVAVVFSAATWVVIGGVVVFGAGQRAFSPAMQAHLMDLFPEGSRGADFGGIRTIYFAIGSLGPAYAGIVAQRLDYTTAFAGFVVTLFAAVCLVAWSSLRES